MSQTAERDYVLGTHDEEVANARKVWGQTLQQLQQVQRLRPLQQPAMYTKFYTSIAQVFDARWKDVT